MNECITFITTIPSKLFDWSPLAFVIVRNANALNPNEIANLEVGLLEKKISLVLTHLIKVNILSTNDSDKALKQHFLFSGEIRWLYLDNLKIFDPLKINLDDLYFRQLGINISRHKQFVYVLKIFQAAAVEKAFGLGKSSLQYNAKEE